MSFANPSYNVKVPCECGRCDRSKEAAMCKLCSTEQKKAAKQPTPERKEGWDCKASAQLLSKRMI